MSYVHDTFVHGDWRVKILQDEDCPSPREWINVGIMVTWWHGYSSPDGQANSWHDIEEFESWYNWQDKDERWVCLPLKPRYYDGGYLIASDQDILENRYVGWIFTTTETVEYTGAPVESLEAQLLAEVEEYNTWASGYCYGYVIERLVPSCSCGECKNWEEVEDGSCWGFIGKILDFYYPDGFPEELKCELRKSGYLGEGV
jgi:hypothetical protein